MQAFVFWKAFKSVNAEGYSSGCSPGGGQPGWSEQLQCGFCQKAGDQRVGLREGVSPGGRACVQGPGSPGCGAGGSHIEAPYFTHREKSLIIASLEERVHTHTHTQTTCEPKYKNLTMAGNYPPKMPLHSWHLKCLNNKTHVKKTEKHSPTCRPVYKPQTRPLSFSTIRDKTLIFSWINTRPC